MFESRISTESYASGTVKPPIWCQHITIIVGIHNPRRGQLPLIGQASNDLGILPRPGERRQQHGREQGKHGKNRHQFDDRETVFMKMLLHVPVIGELC